ncbi:pseudouridine synthase [Mucilaginibacter sp. PAMB04168]|uniref:pseudouridine synthase n=1 Tax=Mucilaginibacter sp. PAMB04168 TaxID=3138567 RepID=UPI0031F65BEC
MVFKKPGNSRDDKSNKSAGRRTGSGDQPRNSSSPRTRNANSGFKKSDDGSAPKKRFGSDTDKKPFSASRKPSTGSYNADDRPKRSYGASTDKKPFAPRGSRPDREGGDKPFKRPAQGADRPFKRNAESGDKPFRKSSEGGFKSDRDSSFKKRTGGEQREGGDKKYSRPTASSRTWSEKPADFQDKPFRERSERSEDRKPARNENADERPTRVLRGRNTKKASDKDESHLIRLNRYISNAGICSRRKADELIAAGVVSVNGEVISELGHKVDPSKDVIRYNGETLKREKMVYVLLNKPKDYITTTEDPQERRTVMHLVEKASRERIYPVGRLDRNTTGLLLMTNDGELADKLSHPRNSITKIYQVELNKSLTQGDLNKISFGLELEDGLIKPDTVSYVQGGTKREVGIQIHSGKNRIVRRIFEHLGYEVVKLDRTIYANLTKKDLPRGRWRYLDEKEIIQLKHLVQV